METKAAEPETTSTFGQAFSESIHEQINFFPEASTNLQSFDQPLNHSMEIQTATSTVATQAYTTHGNPQLLNGFPVCCPTLLIEY